MMKCIVRVVGWVVLLLVIVATAVIVYGGTMIKQGVEVIGPRILGVPVIVEQVRFHPLRGNVSLSGLFIGNPSGFQTEGLFEMRYLEVDIDLASLRTDTVVINRILIDAPQITYEVGLRRTNLGTLLANLEARADGDKKDDKADPDDEPGKAVVIKELVLADARVEVSATAMRGRVVPVQLSTITLTDLGGEDQSITEIATEVVRALLGAVGNAVAGAGDLLGEGLRSAIDGAGALTGRAADGARAVTGAVGDGARGLRDMLPGGDDDEASDEADAVPDKDEAEEKIKEKADEAEKKLRDAGSRLGGAIEGLRGRSRDGETDSD